MDINQKKLLKRFFLTFLILIIGCGLLIGGYYTKFESENFTYIIVMEIGYVFYPAFICVSIFHILLLFSKIRLYKLFNKILLLFLILNFSIIILSIPNYVRMLNDSTLYPRYDSWFKYFINEKFYEGIITATCFSIVIPILDKILQSKKE